MTPNITSSHAPSGNPVDARNPVKRRRLDMRSERRPADPVAPRPLGIDQTRVVPSRRRPKTPAPEPPGPIEQFAAILRESSERERAEHDRQRLERAAAEAAAQAASEHAAGLAAARRELERAIEGARVARRARSGVGAADAAWRQAKARLIELETGVPPPWAHVVDGEDRVDPVDGLDEA
jgi:hypothetical protein